MNFFECHSKQTCGHMQHASGICENGRHMHTPDGIYTKVCAYMHENACMHGCIKHMHAIYAIPCTFWKGGHVAMHKERGRVRK